MLRRPATVLAVIAATGVVSALWFVHANLAALAVLVRHLSWWAILPAVALTCLGAALRFLRWHYFLRRAGIVVPTRESGAVFAASQALLLTPGSVGEAVKAWLVTRRRPSLLPRAVGVVVVERLFDGIALALIGGAALLNGHQTSPGFGLLAAGTAVAVTLGVISAAYPHLETALARASHDGGNTVAPSSAGSTVVVVGLLLSLSIWVSSGLVFLFISQGIGLSVPAMAAVGDHSIATLAGGLSLQPFGSDPVKQALQSRLTQHGVSLEAATAAPVAVRLFSLWLMVIAGAVIAWKVSCRWRTEAQIVQGRGSVAAHFDDLAPEYGAQLSDLARERVVARKVTVMLEHLRANGIEPGAHLLDAGCGHGWYVTALRRAGYRVTAVDLSPKQVAEAAKTLGGGGVEHGVEHARTPLAAASVLALPFRASSFDGAFAVNVLHHVGESGAQGHALAELARVTRPGGIVFIHEINTRNPLFRLYMSYFFPLWKRIDTGVERWLDARALPVVSLLQQQAVEYYSYLPDFAPRWLYSALASTERRLEGSRVAPYAAHFTAVLRRSPGVDVSLRPSVFVSRELAGVTS
ncbi:MAG TPA: lysylphosphatidylglycerol synthase domain-containing protein [Chloroflexota bacterium]|nr:lysylphosphatidylglycerol synthase domain-containing protein [Chloroflexota bacterium]